MVKLIQGCVWLAGPSCCRRKVLVATTLHLFLVPGCPGKCPPSLSHVPARRVNGRRGASPQNASAATTSPPLRLPRPCQAVALIESLTNCTWPSQNSELTPPGCRLRVVTFRDRFCQSAADLSLC